MKKRFVVLVVLLTNGVRSQPCLHGHDRTSEDQKGLIPRRTAGTRLPRNTAAGGRCRACPAVLYLLLNALVLSSCGTTGNVNSNNTGGSNRATPPSLIEMVSVPGGSFQMGSPSGTPESYNSERPVHMVTLSGFKMSKYPVTQAQYQEVMGNNPSYFTSNPASGEVQRNRPVETVTWYDAVEFCNKLSQLEGLTPVYTISGRTPATGYPITSATITADWGKNGYRLPTEAQWEYAAKGGNGSPGNYTYSGGNDPDAVAWYGGNSGEKTHEVGKKVPNGLGLYDMSGNVFEWCWDWDDGYSSGAQTDPTGPASGSHRMGRGGNWFRTAGGVRSAYRGSYSPRSESNSIGFRLVRP